MIEHSFTETILKILHNQFGNLIPKKRDLLLDSEITKWNQSSKKCSCTFCN